MDDTEAKAVLLAMGSQLEWEERFWVGRGLKTESAYFGKGDHSGNTEYRVGKPCRNSGGKYAAFLRPHGDQEHYYDSIIQAKAACERHHATGKWE